MIKWLAGVVIGVFLVFAVLAIFKDQIAYLLFQQNIERQISWDLRDDLADGLHVVFCGTGTPLPDAGRGGACTAIIAGQNVYLFDAGAGSAESLALMGVLPSDVEAVFLTHFHSDHINGLGALALQHVFRGGVDSPLPVYGGPGVERVVSGFNEAYALDHRYRVAHHGTDVAPPSGFELEAFPVMGKSEMTVVLEADGVRISVFEVAHEPVSPAYGYRIDYGGRSVVVSGDTAYSNNLTDAAQGVDLLVHEALAPKLVLQIEKTARRHGRTGLATVMQDIPDYHASPMDAARAAEDAGVATLALTHLIPGLPGALFDELFLGNASEEFSGQILMMTDGDVISLPIAGGITTSSSY